MEKPEQQWLLAYRNGDIEALGQLVEHTRRPLYSFIHRMVKPQEAEEIFQEVWFRAVKNLHKYEEKNIMSWLFRIARNLVIDRTRKKKADVNLEDPGLIQDGGDWHGRLAAGGLGPAELVAGQDLGTRIANAVKELPAEQREVFLMRTEAHLSFKEISAIQETSINTALARMQYALAKLRDQLQGDYEAFQRTAS